MLEIIFVNKSTGRKLTIIDALNTYGLKLKNFRSSQGYDNRADIKSKIVAVEKRILVIKTLSCENVIDTLLVVHVVFSLCSSMKSSTRSLRTSKKLSDTCWEAEMSGVKAVGFQISVIYGTNSKLTKLTFKSLMKQLL